MQPGYACVCEMCICMYLETKIWDEEHLSRKLQLRSKQASATILSSDIMQETSAAGLTLLMKYALLTHAVIHQRSAECPAQARTDKTESGFAVE